MCGVWLAWRGAGEDSLHVGRVREEHIRKIILAGGCCLAFGGAFANVGVVLETGVSVSHLTGDISRLSMNLSHWSPAAVSEAGRVAAAGIGWSVTKRMWLAGAGSADC